MLNGAADDAASQCTLWTSEWYILLLDLSLCELVNKMENERQPARARPRANGSKIMITIAFVSHSWMQLNFFFLLYIGSNDSSKSKRRRDWEQQQQKKERTYTQSEHTMHKRRNSWSSKHEQDFHRTTLTNDYKSKCEFSIFRLYFCNYHGNV